MSQSAFCARCGLEAPIDDPIAACTGCGYVVFVPARYLEWDVALTAKDRDFLRSNRIATT